MANGYYNHGNLPGDNTPGSSAEIRAEFDAVTDGFNKIAAVTGNANKVVVINGAETGQTVKAADALVSDTVHSATSKATPVDADEIGLVDSAASNVLKKLTWANLKATLKTYFDALYPPNSRVALIETLNSAATVDIFGAAGATISIDNSTPVTTTDFTDCTSAQVGSVKRVIPVQDWTVTASASLKVDGATSGNFVMPAGARLEVLATSTTTFELVTKFASGSFTGTATGLTTSPTVTVLWEKKGREFTMYIPLGLNGTSNAVSFTMTGAPSSIAPSANRYSGLLAAADNGVAIAAFIFISSGSSTVQFLTNTTTGAWTNSGSKSVVGMAFSYFA